MKNILKYRGLLSFLLLMLYLLGLVIGSCAISVYPIVRQKQFFLTQARDIAAEYVQGTDDTFRSMIGANMHIYIFDANGICLRHAASNKSTDTSSEPVVSLDRDLARVLSGGTLFRPAMARYWQRSYNSICLLYTSPSPRD